jgi:hypothetical protein
VGAAREGLVTSGQALALLAQLGAHPWLVRHHELVVEAAEILCDRVARELAVPFDRELVLAGAALHDAGKIVCAAEMHAPGHAHEAAGRALLIERGVPDAIARFCVTHAAWDDDVAIEDLLVALADKLWKGRREESLELKVMGALAAASGRAAWEAFTVVDAICEAIASGGPDRLARSAV